jgi:hypothetical protein
VNPTLGAIARGIALAPRLLTVKARAVLADPTTTLPNEVDAGLSVTGVTPVPVMEPIAGLPKPL